ncbi:MAG: PIN domain-containing protein [Nanoarchaeota archaeon]
MKRFFDSYALIEMVKGNPHYARFLDDEIATTIFNLAEVIYSALRDYGEDRAGLVARKYSPSIMDIDHGVLSRAMLFRRQNSKKDLSYADCVGYTMAREMGISFLTGDEQFRGFDGVEFVKA